MRLSMLIIVLLIGQSVFCRVPNTPDTANTPTGGPGPGHATSATPTAATAMPAATITMNNGAWDAIGLNHVHFAVFRHPVRVAIIDDGFDPDNPAWAASIAHNSRKSRAMETTITTARPSNT